METTTTLRAALLDAQRAIHAVGRDAKNSYHNYNYTSAESIVVHCRAALNSAGLTLTRASEYEFSPDSTIWIRSVWTLSAATDTSEQHTTVWPVIPDKGRPIDKAFAGALTSSLAYYLRDLLLVPRADEDESMDRRDDTKHEQAKKTMTTGVAVADAPKRLSVPAVVPTTLDGGEATDSAEVIASRPPRDCAWFIHPYTVVRAGDGKPTVKGTLKYSIMLRNASGVESWASTFDDRVWRACKGALDSGSMIEVLVQDSKFGWTLYGVRAAAPETQSTAANGSDGIPF